MAAGPPSAASLFAWSIEDQNRKGHALSFIVLAILAMLVVVGSLTLPPSLEAHLDNAGVSPAHYPDVRGRYGIMRDRHQRRVTRGRDHGHGQAHSGNVTEYDDEMGIGLGHVELAHALLPPDDHE